MLRPTFACLVLGPVSLAYAQEPAPLASPDAPATSLNASPRENPLLASITVSPVHFALPAGELTAELAVTPKIGVAVIGGIGSVKPALSNTRVLVYEVGISPRYYIWGNFRQGVELGVEALYVHASADDATMTTVSAEGLAIGPYVGYKWVARVGLTLEAQLGASYFAVRGDGVDEEDSRFAALLNLQVGWSF
ncbi:MAG: hypothetical protein ACKV2T_09815 [Kofleriaceae bacterium]